jgi:thiol-disulfide isomerase/thioredoxin
VLRGGDGGSAAIDLRSAMRAGGWADNVSTTAFGFRVVLVDVQSTGPAAQPGWVSLFNGKDFSGWQLNGKTWTPAAGLPWKDGQTTWRIQDGAIVADCAGEVLHERIQTASNLPKYFHLRFEVNVKRGRRGALSFHDREGNPWWLNFGEGKSAPNLLDVYINQGAGMISNAAKFDEWMRVEVIAKDSLAEVWLNGKKVIDLKHASYAPVASPIGLRVRDGAELHFRRIEIREMPPSEPGWVRLFNGKDLTGWKSPDKSSWTITDGELHGRAGGKAYSLVTERADFENFHLRGQARLTNTKINQATVAGLGNIWFRLGDDTTGYRAHLTTMAGGAGTLGARLTPNAPPLDLAKPPAASMADQKWVAFEIIAHGPAITVKIDGKVTAQVSDARFHRGAIALESLASGAIAFKNIEIKELPPIVTPAPEIVGEDLDGKSFKLSGQRGKVVVLDFWADWCPYCRLLHEHKRTLEQRLAGKPFVWVGVNIDKSSALAKKALVREKLGGLTLWDGQGVVEPGQFVAGPICKAFGVKATPTLIFLDHQGNIRARLTGMPKDLAQVDRIIDELLAAARHVDLSKTQPHYEARFDKPVAGWLIEKKGFYDQGFADGRYFIAVNAKASRSVFCPAEPIDDFVCEAVGRVTGSLNTSWVLEVQNVSRDRYLYFTLNGKQDLLIRAAGKDAGKFKTIGPIRHPAIKAGEAFNTLRIVGRNGKFEVFVNGVSVCEPVATDFVKTSATFRLVAVGAPIGTTRAEFERLTIWPAPPPAPKEPAEKDAPGPAGQPGAQIEPGVPDYAEVHDADEKGFDGSLGHDDAGNRRFAGAWIRSRSAASGK